MQVDLFNYTNFLEAQSNPRLIAYYNYLQEQGYSPCFCFLKSKNKVPNSYRHKQFGWHILPGFLNTFFGILHACFYLISTRPKHVYIYASHLLYLPIYIICKISRIELTIEKTELDSIKPSIGLKDSLNSVLYFFDEKIMPLLQPKMVVITPLLEQYYREKGIKQLHLTGLFMPLKTAALHSDIEYNKELTIGYLGSFADKDDLSTLISSCEIVAHHKINMTLVLIGAFNEHFSSNELNFTINQKGELERHILPIELAKCHILVAIRKNNPYSNYGYPSKLGEYFETGRPVICSANIALPVEFESGKNIYLIPPESPDKLAETIASIWSDYNAAAAIGIQGKITAIKEFNTETILGDWFNFIYA